MAEELTRKQFVAKAIEVDDDERTVTAVISTGDIDRDGEVLIPKGVELDNYRKNPVVLFAHDYWSAPIGKALYVDAKRKSIVSLIKFAPRPKDFEGAWKPDEIYELFKGGYLKAFSVGFIPKEIHSPTPDEIRKKPELADARRIYDKWELLEFSVVPVPANPAALATSVKSKSITISDELIKVLGVKIEDAIPKQPVEPDEFALTQDELDDMGEEETEEPEIKVRKPVAVKKPPTVKRPIKLTRHVPVKRAISQREVESEAIKLLRGKVYS